MSTLSINQWDESDRPREKMAAKGASALSDAELLAILIGSGSQDDSAVALMQRVLSQCKNNLFALGQMSIDQLCSFKGIGPAKAITILAACELGRRRSISKPLENPTMNKSQSIYEYFRPIMQDLTIEECWVMLLNQSLRIISCQKVSQGGINNSIVDIRLVMRHAIVQQATAIVFCHNHPSGNNNPSIQDDQVTAKIKEASKTLAINFIDHIIVTSKSYFSYSDEGRL